MIVRWFERSPERLERELQALDTAGFEYEIKEAARDAGQVILTIKYPDGEDIHRLTVTFPDSFPYFPFQISAPSFPGGRHKDPYTHTLCLFQDAQNTWSTHDNLAGVLTDQVPQILQAHRDPAGAADIEANEGLRPTGYFPYTSGTVIFTGEWDIPREYDRGTLLIGIDPRGDVNEMVRGAVLEVRNADGHVLAKIDPVIRKRYSNTQSGRWVRLAAPPKTVETGILNEAIEQWPALDKPLFRGGPDIVGLLFPEERDYHELKENWAFVVRRKVKLAGGKRSHHNQAIKGYIARADRATRENIQTRTPRLAPLAGKKVLVAGLGAIGSIVAWQLARAGIGRMHVLDADHVELGNSPRWLLGASAVGHHKAHTVGAFLAQEYPFLDIHFFYYRIGSTAPHDPRQGDATVMPEVLEGVDLVLDATAEWSVNLYLSDLARELGIPYIWATGTPGSWGGVVGRSVPGKTEGCWHCYQRSLGDDTIRLPAQEDIPDVQPVGCFHPTFTGSGFDMDHVSLMAARMAVATLCAEADDGYPDFEWDVGVLDLWRNGQPIAPKWDTYSLKRHPECDVHD